MSIDVEILTVGGECYTVSSRDEDTVGNIKEKLFQECGIDSDRQALYFLGYHLDEDTVTVKDLLKTLRKELQAKYLFFVVFPFISWLDGSTDKDLDTDRDAFTILQNPFMTVLTGRNRRTLLNLTTKHFVLLYPTRREAKSGMREYVAEFYEVQRAGQLEVVLNEDINMTKSLAICTEDGSPIGFKMLSTLTHDETTKCPDNGFMSSLNDYFDFMMRLIGQLKELEEAEITGLDSSACKMSLEENIHLEANTSSGETEKIIIPITCTIYGLVEKCKEVFTSSKDSMTMFWGELCLDDEIKKNGGNMSIQLMCKAISCISDEVPRLFALLPMAGTSESGQKSHFFFEQHVKGISNVKQLQLQQEKAVKLDAENFDIAWIEVNEDRSQTRHVTRYNTKGSIGKAKMTLSFVTGKKDCLEVKLMFMDSKTCISLTGKRHPEQCHDFSKLEQYSKEYKDDISVLEVAKRVATTYYGRI